MPKSVSSKEIAHEELNPHELVFLQSLRDALPTLKFYSDRQLSAKIGREKLTDLALEFYAFMEYGAGTLTKNEQLALAYQLWKCLSSYISNVGTPINLNTLVNSLGLLQAAVDQAFPGYARSKLLKYTIYPLRG